MIYVQQVRRIRRFLRDPKARLWGDEFLRVCYNLVQRELATRSFVLENVQSLRTPPSYTWSVQTSWEYGFAEGEIWQCCHEYPQSAHVACHRWEVQQDLGQGVTAADGAQFTHPWEAWLGETVAVPVAWPLPEDFDRMTLLAYDREPIEHRAKRDIMRHDTTWMNRQSETFSYYLEDQADNRFVPYPRPAAQFDDGPQASKAEAYSWMTSYEWESDYIIDGVSDDFTFFNNAAATADQCWYTCEWENGLSALSDEYTRAMWLFEAGRVFEGGTVTSIGAEVDSVGTVTGGALLDQEVGGAIDAVDDQNQFLVIYRATPVDIEGADEESRFPEWVQKTIECGVLERAYAAHTDGRIESLRGYWAMRYRHGLTVMQRWTQNRQADRQYRLVTQNGRQRRSERHARLPDEFPAV